MFNITSQRITLTHKSKVKGPRRSSDTSFTFSMFQFTSHDYGEPRVRHDISTKTSSSRANNATATTPIQTGLREQLSKESAKKPLCLKRPLLGQSSSGPVGQARLFALVHKQQARSERRRKITRNSTEKKPELPASNQFSISSACGRRLGPSSGKLQLFDRVSKKGT